MNPSNSVYNPGDRGYPSASWRVAEVVSVALGFLLLFSSLTKIAAPRGFYDMVSQFGLLPPKLTVPAAAGVVGLELSLSVLLITGIFRRIAAWLNFLLMLGFVGLMAEAIRRGFEHCGCFGEVLQLKPSQEIWIDLLLLGMTLVVLWRGRDRRWGGVSLRHGLAWGVFVLGAALFLAGGPAVGGGNSTHLEVDPISLGLLEGAVPPLRLPEDALIFFFSADCEHCWAFAGGVQMTADTLKGLKVIGMTFSGEPALSQFREAFHPSYPIHRISLAAFKELMPVWPGAIWIQNGEVAQAWSNFVPSHRELADLGGYEMGHPGVSAAAHEESPEASDSEPSGATLFGGVVTGRH